MMEKRRMQATRMGESSDPTSITTTISGSSISNSNIITEGNSQSDNSSHHHRHRHRHRHRHHRNNQYAMVALKVLVGLIILIVLVQFGTIISFFNIHSIDNINPHFDVYGLVKQHAQPPQQEQAEQQPQQKLQQEQKVPSHFFPQLKPLPALAIIENDLNEEIREDLVEGTMNGSNPTIIGVAMIIQRFLLEFHQLTQQTVSIVKKQERRDNVQDRKRQKAKGKPQLTEEEIREQKRHEQYNLRDQYVVSYIDLLKKYLLPFDEQYRGRPIFPIRNDDSIYLSLVAFREHLLGKTLIDAYEKAKNPHQLYVGIVVQNCFGFDYKCKTGIQVVGKKKDGTNRTGFLDSPPDVNGIEEFCSYKDNNNTYCNTGQIRVIYINETEANGPTMARYYASKLWGGETYYIQIDSHLIFAQDWDHLYIQEIQATKSYPKSILSAYPPGFLQLHRLGNSSGTRLCTCEFSTSEGEGGMIRLVTGRNYPDNYDQVPVAQIAFMAAGFFMAHAQFIVDVPFDPLLPWCFVGEEVTLSIRAWTSGWNMYAPRTNLIAHQYRPMSMGIPKFWESVDRTFHRRLNDDRLEAKFMQRIKYIMGYPKTSVQSIYQSFLEERNPDGSVTKRNRTNLTDAFGDAILMKLDHYGLGTVRTREEFLNMTHIDFKSKQCHRNRWCALRKLE